MATMYRAAVVAALFAVTHSKLALTPPMGWMSWEIYRCDVDCTKNPDACINEALYKAQTDALVADGYLAAGYDGIHIDDCWMQLDPSRDSSGKLVPNATRFPSGFKGLGDYMHGKGVRFAIYTAESPTTCAGYPASAKHEVVDADTFASWGVDYLKVDGCGDKDYYPTGYPAMGAALQKSGRDIVYSCSWPAYLGSNESEKPYQQMIDIGCNLWRNYADIQCRWSSLANIIDHWGDWGSVIAKFAGPGHWNDPDMLLIGNDCITDDEARTQMAIWSIVAAPLIMGNDLRNITDSQKAILVNKEAIAVNQDSKGIQGLRINSDAHKNEVWARPLADGAVAVGLYNTGKFIPAPPGKCEWNITTGGYLEACGGPAGDESSFSGLTAEEAKQHCCEDAQCAGLSYDSSTKTGYYKFNADCGFVSNPSFTGYNKPGFKPPSKGPPAKITVQFSDIGISGTATVRDIWTQKDLGSHSTSFTAEVPYHATGFFRITPA